MRSVFQNYSILLFTKSHPKKGRKGEAFEVKKSFSFSLDKILMGQEVVHKHWYLCSLLWWLGLISIPNPINLFSSIDIDLQSSKASLIWSNLSQVGFSSTPNSWTVLISRVGFPSTPNSLSLSKEMDTSWGLIIGIYKSFSEWFSSSSQVFYNLFHSYNPNFWLYLCLK